MGQSESITSLACFTTTSCLNVSHYCSTASSCCRSLAAIARVSIVAVVANTSATTNITTTIAVALLLFLSTMSLAVESFRFVSGRV